MGKNCGCLLDEHTWPSPPTPALTHLPKKQWRLYREACHPIGRGLQIVGDLYNSLDDVIDGCMAGMTAFAESAMKSMRAMVIHLRSGVMTLMRCTKCNPKAQPHRDLDDIILHI